MGVFARRLFRRAILLGASLNDRVVLHGAGRWCLRFGALCVDRAVHLPALGKYAKDGSGAYV